MAQQVTTDTQQLPPMVPSDEATKAQLRLAQRQGDAYAKAVEAMDKESGVQLQRAGDYEIGLVAEKAEGMYHPRDAQLHWIEPQDDNVHFEVVVRDAADGRFVPNLRVLIRVDTADGQHIGIGEVPFVWHPWLFHYGANWRVPGEGDYRVWVRVEPPTFMRHDRENGRRYIEPAEADFTIHITPGQKHS
jgi:uncharacterized protein involved in high-affinity Fe2+ transport